MKRFISAIVCGLLIFAVGCSNKSGTETSEQEVNQTQNEQVQNQFDIKRGTEFSEGKAFVTGIQNDQLFNGIINTKGELLYKFPDNTSVVILEFPYCSFDNGMAVVQCDNKDTIILEDGYKLLNDHDRVIAIGGGYAVLQKNPSGYQKGDNTYTVIDNKGNILHEWAPSKELKDITSNKQLKHIGNGYFLIPVGYGSNNVVYNAPENKYINFEMDFIGSSENYFFTNILDDFRIYDFKGNLVSSFNDVPSEEKFSTYGFYQDQMIGFLSGTELLKKNQTAVFAKRDISGKIIYKKDLGCTIRYGALLNDENTHWVIIIEGADGYYFTLVDNEGNFLFEPKKFHEIAHFTAMNFNISPLSDGLIKIGNSSNTSFYDVSGNLIFNIPVDCSKVTSFSDGIAKVSPPAESDYYIDKTGNKLF